MKLIYAEMVLAMLEAFKDEKYGDPHFMNGIATVRELIEDVPEAVVRCRDCKYIGPLSPPDDYNACTHNRAMVYAPVDGFCCWGERRTDEADQRR